MKPIVVNNIIVCNDIFAISVRISLRAAMVRVSYMFSPNGPMHYCNWLIPIRSAKLCGALKHEKHRGGLPCGWGREAPKEHWRIT